MDGEITAIIPQFVVFEISYVFQTMDGATGERLATLIRDGVTLSGARVADDCRWKESSNSGPIRFLSLADAAILAVARVQPGQSRRDLRQEAARPVKDAGIGTHW